MVGPHKADHPAFDHRDRLPPVPDIFANERAGGLVVLGDPAAFGVEDRIWSRPGWGRSACEWSTGQVALGLFSRSRYERRMMKCMKATKLTRNMKNTMSNLASSHQ